MTDKYTMRKCVAMLIDNRLASKPRLVSPEKWERAKEKAERFVDDVMDRDWEGEDFDVLCDFAFNNPGVSRPRGESPWDWQTALDIVAECHLKGITPKEYLDTACELA